MERWRTELRIHLRNGSRFRRDQTGGIVRPCYFIVARGNNKGQSFDGLAHELYLNHIDQSNRDIGTVKFLPT
jgi:hypothetical protein